MRIAIASGKGGAGKTTVTEEYGEDHPLHSTTTY